MKMILHKRYIFIIISGIIFLLTISCNKDEYIYEDDEIFYRWVVENYSTDIREEEAVIFVELRYYIKNKSNKDIWLYDQENGSLWQTIRTSINHNTIESIYSMYKKWADPLPYDYSHPKSVYIKSNDVISNLIKIRYYPYSKGNTVDLTNITMQRFNFFILGRDISTNQDNEYKVKNIAEKHSKSYIVELPVGTIFKRQRKSTGLENKSLF